MRSLAEVLAESYRFTATGHGSTPTFDPADYDRAALETALSDLEAVAERCVISKIQAAWLRAAIA